eukprot:gene4083-20263_t
MPSRCYESCYERRGRSEVKLVLPFAVQEQQMKERPTQTESVDHFVLVVSPLISLMRHQGDSKSKYEKISSYVRTTS